MTVQDAFLEYRRLIEAGRAPKTLSAAFAAGARAALEILSDPPFACCVLGAERIQELDNQLDEMTKVPNQTVEAQKAAGGRE